MEPRASEKGTIIICYVPKIRLCTEMALTLSFTSKATQGWVSDPVMGWQERVQQLRSPIKRYLISMFIIKRVMNLKLLCQTDSHLCSSSYPGNYTWLRSFWPWYAILIARMTTEGFRWEIQWKVGWILPFGSHEGLVSMEGLRWGMMFWEKCLELIPQRASFEGMIYTSQDKEDLY